MIEFFFQRSDDLLVILGLSFYHHLITLGADLMAPSSDDGASDATEDDPQVPDHASTSASASRGDPPTAVPSPSATPSQPTPAQSAPTHSTASNAIPTVVDRGNNPRYELRHILRGHSMSLSSVKFSPDGNLLASTGVLTLYAVVVSFGILMLQVFG